MAMIILDAQTTIRDYIPVIIQVVVTLGAIFGGAGFWQWKQEKDRAKRDKESKENGIESKVDNMSTQFSELSAKLSNLTIDMQDIKKDITLLQEANRETVKYRELRDANDKAALKAQHAIIESLKGLLRERLLSAYKQCMTKGYYTKEERETYSELFRCYESEPFAGNGIMHQLRPIMQALPWTKEDAD
jgi:outer membrane murein-binding lipoprotein Lpp